MHVAMVTSVPHPGRSRGGVAMGTACLIRALMRKGVRVTVLEFEPASMERYIHPSLNCQVIPIFLHRPAFIMNWLRSARDVAKVVEEVRPDVVHVQDVPELGVALRCPRVFTVRGINPKDEWLLGGRRRYVTVPVMSFSYWWCKRKYSHVILISPYARQIGGFRRDAHLFDIPNPVEDCFFEIKREGFTPTVLVVGLLSKLKNTLAVVQAAARLRQAIPDVQFRVVGPWRDRGDSLEYRRQVEELLEREKLAGTVHFLGLMSQQGVMDELSRAGCLFLPSFQENLPMTIIEAMASGIPAVASRVGGIPWMVDEGKTGLLFDPHSLDEMVECLGGLLTSRTRCEEMGRMAQQVALSRFRADVVAEQTLAVYRDAMG
jgi:glycosyltransferase involved in cell wall biosynthesis